MAKNHSHTMWFTLCIWLKETVWQNLYQFSYYFKFYIGSRIRLHQLTKKSLLTKPIFARLRNIGYFN